jgi:hypothetical protein
VGLIDRKIINIKNYLILGVFILLIISVTLRFWPWMPHVLAGDDLINFLAFKDGRFASSLHQSLTGILYQKYRPVFSLMMVGLFSWFDKNITHYLYVGLLLQSINAVLVYLIAQKLSRHWLIALMIAVVVGVSRFALYQVVQLTGLVEALAMMFFLLTIYFFLCADKNKKYPEYWIICSIMTAFLAINTHERYVVLFPWLVGAIILQPAHKPLSLMQKAILIVVSTILLLVNVLYKKMIMQIPFFVGTGGALINIKFQSVFILGMQAILTILGFNKGSEDQIGIKFTHLDWFPSKILVLIFAIGIVGIIVWGIRIALNNSTKNISFWQKLYWPILLIILFVLLLLPPIMTTHLEQRWLLEPFIVLLLLFVWALNEITDISSTLAVRLAVMVSLSVIISDTIIIKHSDQLFFMESTHFAAMVKRDIIDKKPTKITPIAFITWRANCTWSLGDGEFFRVYEGSPRQIFCFKNHDEYVASKLAKSIPLYEIKQKSLSLRCDESKIGV